MKCHQFSKYKLSFLLLIFFFCFTVKSNSQLLSSKDSETDVELWTGLDFAKEINKDLTLSFALQTRLRENISITKSNFGQIGLTFPIKKISKKLKVTTSIRINRNENAKWTTRPMIDIAYRTYRNDFIDVGYRIRLQKSFENIVTENFSNFVFFDDFYWRNRITLKYRKLKDVEPYIAVSLFKNVGRQTIIADQFRVITGFSYKVNKRHSLKLSYIYREKFNTKNQEINHVISAKFYFDIKNFKKKKQHKKGKDLEKDNTKYKQQKSKDEKVKKLKKIEPVKEQKKPTNRSKPLGPHRIEP